jgi:hypothetical protein
VLMSYIPPIVRHVRSCAICTYQTPSCCYWTRRSILPAMNPSRLAIYMAVAVICPALFAQVKNAQPSESSSASVRKTANNISALAKSRVSECPTAPVIPRSTMCSKTESVTLIPNLSASKDEDISGQIGTFRLCDGAVIRFADHYVDWGDSSGPSCSILPITDVGPDNGKLFGSHLYTDFGSHKVSIEIPAICVVKGKKDTFKKTCGFGVITVYDSLPLIAPFALDQSNVTVGTSVLGTVTLESRAGTEGVLINVSADVPNVVQFPSPVLVAPSAKSGTFQITTLGVTPATGVKITVSSGGTSLSSTLIIH